MKVCIDGIIQEVEETLEELHIDPPKNLDDEVAGLKQGFAKLEKMFEPLAKLLGQK